MHLVYKQTLAQMHVKAELIVLSSVTLHMVSMVWHAMEAVVLTGV